MVEGAYHCTAARKLPAPAPQEHRESTLRGGRPDPLDRNTKRSSVPLQGSRQRAFRTCTFRGAGLRQPASTAWPVQRRHLSGTRARTKTNGLNFPTLPAANAGPHFFMRDFMRTERARWVFCMSVSSSPLAFQRPLWSTSTAASWTFCQPWKRPRWLIVPTAFGKAWCTSWKSISFQRCLPPRTKAIVLCKIGQVRPGSLAKNWFHGRECVKLVMNIHAAEKPQRAKKDTVNMKRQPSERFLPSGHVPSSHTQVHRQNTKELCFTQRGTHLDQNSLLHLPPAPSPC